MQYFEEFGSVIEKLLFNYKIDRNDEAKMFSFLSSIYGENNVLTRLAIAEKGIEYFGCAICENGKWTVYNLAGFAEGVVVKIGKSCYLEMKVG